MFYKYRKADDIVLKEIPAQPAENIFPKLKQRKDPYTI